MTRDFFRPPPFTASGSCGDVSLVLIRRLTHLGRRFWHHAVAGVQLYAYAMTCTLLHGPSPDEIDDAPTATPGAPTDPPGFQEPHPERLEPDSVLSADELLWLVELKNP